jgi:hypothetical protein
MCSTVFKLIWILVFSCCKRIEADIQLRTQFPSRNPPIGADELIKTLFISWCDSSAWPSGTWLVLHLAVATAETRHPPPHFANIYCLFSGNTQQLSMNVIACIFLRMEEFNYTPLLHMHFHVRLPLCCHLSHGSKV